MESVDWQETPPGDTCLIHAQPKYQYAPLLRQRSSQLPRIPSTPMAQHEADGEALPLQYLPAGVYTH